LGDPSVDPLVDLSIFFVVEKKKKNDPKAKRKEDTKPKKEKRSVILVDQFGQNLCWTANLAVNV
jgi:hypothetical protein